MINNLIINIKFKLKQNILGPNKNILQIMLKYMIVKPFTKKLFDLKDRLPKNFLIYRNRLLYFFIRIKFSQKTTNIKIQAFASSSSFRKGSVIST